MAISSNLENNDYELVHFYQVDKNQSLQNNIKDSIKKALEPTHYIASLRNACFPGSKNITIHRLDNARNIFKSYGGQFVSIATFDKHTFLDGCYIDTHAFKQSLIKKGCRFEERNGAQVLILPRDLERAYEILQEMKIPPEDIQVVKKNSLEDSEQFQYFLHRRHPADAYTIDFYRFIVQNGGSIDYQSNRVLFPKDPEKIYKILYLQKKSLNDFEKEPIYFKIPTYYEISISLHVKAQASSVNKMAKEIVTVEKGGNVIAVPLGGNGMVYEQDRQRIFQILLMGQSLLAYNPRGYGYSQGVPSEMGFYDDVDAAFQYAKTLGFMDIIFWGYCQGAGAASYAASKHGGDHVHLVIDRAATQVTDITDPLIEENISQPILQYPAKQMVALAAPSYKNAERLENMKGSLLLVHAKEDELINKKSRQKFRQKAIEHISKDKRTIAATNKGHNDTWDSKIYGIAASHFSKQGLVRAFIVKEEKHFNYQPPSVIQDDYMENLPPPQLHNPLPPDPLNNNHNQAENEDDFVFVGAPPLGK